MGAQCPILRNQNVLLHQKLESLPKLRITGPDSLFRDYTCQAASTVVSAQGVLKSVSAILRAGKRQWHEGMLQGTKVSTQGTWPSCLPLNVCFSAEQLDAVCSPLSLIRAFGAGNN